LLLPLAWIYGFIVAIRNLLFDMGVLKQKSYDIPVIGIGNITVGGTGKTPHTEYLIKLLQKDYQVAVLSRGYKRKSKGFVLANKLSTMEEIGDEPLQMKTKFPDIHVAVDANRRNGISRLLADDIKPAVDVILMDDSFQHRYVLPDINILLVNYNRLITRDYLLPAGRLRETIMGKERADIVIVTKCPADITPVERNGIERELALRYHQKIFFTTMSYPILMPQFKEAPLLVTGIASPQQMEEDLRKFYPGLELMAFSDHHAFSDADIEAIKKRAAGRHIITTEKDSTRLKSLPHTVIPIEVEFIGNEEEKFNKIILDHVRQNSRNSRLHQ
jgi:tetraacyldisaccharide 4'-kinase